MARSSSRTSNGTKDSSASLGFEAKLWLAADKLRSNMDAAEYKHVVLGLIFLKYISDKFEEHHAKLAAGKGEFAGADPSNATNMSLSMFSGFRPRPAGRSSSPTPSSPTSASGSTMRWSRSKKPTSARTEKIR